MIIETKERTEAHVRVYFERTQDAEIQAMLPQTVTTEERALENFHRTQLPGADSCGRTIYADGVYIGDIWCYCIYLGDEPNAMLSYCIFEKEYWGKGIATVVLGQFLREMVSRFGLKSVGAFTYCDNFPSRRVLEKNGFALVETFAEGGVESAYYQRNTEDML